MSDGPGLATAAGGAGGAANCFVGAQPRETLGVHLQQDIATNRCCVDWFLNIQC